MDKRDGMDQGIRVLSYLVSGIGFYGALGWLADTWFHTSFLLPVGIIFGTIAAMYMIIKRYGRVT
ncbi:AtpZ/AtpI family protein [Propionicicella superfundia]|uniref:AtpZ/AtpI family protein n=1 Tax=Propionicicella superfundia TaxID=348582 RepID=UPI001FE0B361|nr:AtpZ/AtpI family protein [Propionicicella superfundia]